MQGLHELTERVKASGGFMEMGVGRRMAQSAELGARAARENFALFSMDLGLGKRELLLEGLPHGARIVVIAPKVLEEVWAKHAAKVKVGVEVRTYSREYARMNPVRVGLDVATHCDYLIIEEPQGAATCRKLAQIAIKASRTIIVGFSAPGELGKRLTQAATVLGVAPNAMSVVLLAGGSTTPGGAK